MKKCFFLAIMLLIATLGQTQITNLQSKDSSVIVENVYIGLLNSVNFNADSLSYSSSSDFRIGAMGTWHVASWLDVKSVATYDRSNNKDATFNNFSLKFHSSNLSMELGKMGTPTTEVRPLPPTADGHFETWTECRFPGSALGAKVGYQIAKIKISMGIFSRGNKPEYSGHISLKNINLAGCYAEAGKKYTIGATYKTAKFYNVAVFENNATGNKTVANFINIHLFPQKKVDGYCDAGYDLKRKNFPRFETGLIKNFSVTIGNHEFQGLIALGYCNEIKKNEFKGYLFFHL